MTRTERQVLIAIRDGKTVHPTGARKTAIERLMSDRMIRRVWIDDNTPARVITKRGLQALETAPAAPHASSRGARARRGPLAGP